MARWGAETRLKLLGGELIFRQRGHSYDDMVRQLDFTRKRALDLTAPFQAFQETYREQTLRVFEEEGLPVPWPGLSLGYAAWKARAYPGKSIMRRTDRLFESVTGGSEGFWDVGPRSIRFGTRVP